MTVSLNEPYEIIRLAFAKTDAGAEEIASWSDGTELDLELTVMPPPIPIGDEMDDEGDDAMDEFAMVAEAASMGGGGIFLLLLLLLV